jgi:CHAD domain-containing protein
VTNRLPVDLLRRSPQEASRLLVLGYLDEVGRAQRRLADAADQEALHDFRVGLRRLRSCLRAYRAALKGSVSGKMRRRLRALTQETNTGRDTEVQIAWLRNQASGLGPGEAEGLGWLVGRLEGRKSVLGQTTANVARRFLKLESRLRPRLLTFELEVSRAGGREPVTFGVVTAGLLRSHAAGLCEALGSVRGPYDQAETHSTRIKAKRLRYLIEPLSPRLPRLKGYVKRLKELQGTLGTLHDLQVLLKEIPSDVAAPVDAGFAALRRRAEQEIALSLEQFLAEWTPRRGETLRKRLEAVSDRLESLSRDGDRPDATDAPTPPVMGWAEAPLTALSLTTTPLPLRFPLQPQSRLR